LVLVLVLVVFGAGAGGVWCWCWCLVLVLVLSVVAAATAVVSLLVVSLLFDPSYSPPPKNAGGGWGALSCGSREAVVAFLVHAFGSCFEEPAVRAQRHLLGAHLRGTSNDL